MNVVKHKSFSKAADACFLTQPTISSHIITLEKELGVRLIDRHGKQAIPTMQGKILYKHAVTLLNTREKAISSLNEYTNEISGVLELQVSSIPGEYMVPGLMSGFMKQYPQVKFHLEQTDSSRAEENLLQHKGELGFVGHKVRTELFSERLISDSMKLITPINDKFKALEGKKLKVVDFIEEPFVWREHGSATRHEFEQKIAETGFDPKRMNVIARTNSMEAIKQAVSNGLGISVISGIAAGNRTDCKSFMTFDIEDLHMCREFYLIWNRHTALSPTSEAFKKFVLDHYRRQNSMST